MNPADKCYLLILKGVICLPPLIEHGLYTERLGSFPCLDSIYHYVACSLSLGSLFKVGKIKKGLFIHITQILQNVYFFSIVQIVYGNNFLFMWTCLSASIHVPWIWMCVLVTESFAIEDKLLICFNMKIY